MFCISFPTSYVPFPICSFRVLPYFPIKYFLTSQFYCHGIQCRINRFLQTSECVIAISACVLFCMTPYSFNWIEFTMELGDKHNSVTLIQDHFFYLGFLKFKISHFFNDFILFQFSCCIYLYRNITAQFSAVHEIWACSAGVPVTA